MAEIDIATELQKGTDRQHWLDELTSVKEDCERRMAQLAKRVARLERHSVMPSMDDETRTMVMGLGLLLLVQVAPILLEGFIRWRQRSASSSS